MKLLAGEKMVMESNQGLLQLTSRRVRLEETGGGASKLVTITLDAVASCGLVTKSYPLLLALAVMAALFGVTQLQRGGVGATLLVAAIALVIAYFWTRSAVLEIRSSGGGAIIVGARSMNRNELVSFIDAVEEAKLSGGAAEASFAKSA